MCYTLGYIPACILKVGLASHGGMSFEQKKRVSIGIELAANPSIIFLDEPTTGRFMLLFILFLNDPTDFVDKKAVLLLDSLYVLSCRFG